MPEDFSQRQSVLYVLVCAAPPAQSIQEFVTRAQGKGWDVCVLVTPQATRFVDMERLTAVTGHLVRNDYKLPGESDPLPKADAIVVVPATFNTINKWAGGIADTLVTAVFVRLLGEERRLWCLFLASRWIWCAILHLLKVSNFSEGVA